MNQVPLPLEAKLIADLKEVRRRGIARLGDLALPALRQVVRAAGRDDPDEPVRAYMIEGMLAEALSRLGDALQETAALLFGLLPGTRGDPPAKLRRDAAGKVGVGLEHFRHKHEPEIVSQLCQLLLGEAHDHQLRLSRLRDHVRTPVDSRLAVEWLGRFDAMYRIWTPVHGLGADLTAFRSTLLEEDRPWDGHLDANHPDERYSQERQAAGYITTALYWHTTALAALRRFEIEFGGRWMLPEAQAENDIADAIYRITLASPNGQRDDSCLRVLLSQSPDHEMHPFLTLMAEDEVAMAIHQDWLDWAFTCTCQWQPGERHGRELFPTHHNHPRISPRCDLHAVVDACNDFCLLLDDAWDAIADWYHDVPRPRRRNLTAEEIHAHRGSPLPTYLAQRKQDLAPD